MARKPPSAVALDSITPSVNMLLYSRHGSGKTVWGGLGVDLIISCEKDRGMSARAMGSTAQLVQCKDFDDFEAAKQAWEDGYYGDPEWTMFDSATSIQEKLAQAINEREHRASPAKRKLDVFQIQDYLELQNATKRIVAEVCDVPRNVLFTAQDMHIDTDDDELVLPYIDGKKGGISTIICGMMTAVGFMKVLEEDSDKEPVRRIYWQPHHPYATKDWTNSLGKYTDDVPLSECWRRIQAKTGGSIPSGPIAAANTSKRKPPTAVPPAAGGAAARRAARTVAQ
jgi:hypothetical protein